MKECELCSLPARMFCESDQASLCLKCDSKVHSANFLVARHSRTLLCQSCQSLTPWQTSGSKIGPTLTVCERCVAQCNARKEEAGAVEEEEADETDNDEDEDIDDETDDGNDDDDDDDSGDIGNGNEDEEDGENQVVPWTSSSSTAQPPQPPMASSSSSEDSSSSRFYKMTSSSSLKRNREHVGIGSQDDFCSSSSQQIVNEEDFIRSTKDRKRALNESKSVKIINSIKRFEKKLISRNDEKVILGICNLSEDCSTSVDLVSNDSPTSPI